MPASETKVLLIFVDETDTWEDLPLYEAIVRRLARAGMAGATVQTGIMGFGSHLKVHRKRLFGISDDRPVTITVVDAAEKIRGVLPVIKPLVTEGLMVLVDAEVVV